MPCAKSKNIYKKPASPQQVCKKYIPKIKIKRVAGGMERFRILKQLICIIFLSLAPLMQNHRNPLCNSTRGYSAACTAILFFFFSSCICYRPISDYKYTVLPLPAQQCTHAGTTLARQHVAKRVSIHGLLLLMLLLLMLLRTWFWKQSSCINYHHSDNVVVNERSSLPIGTSDIPLLHTPTITSKVVQNAHIAIVDRNPCSRTLQYSFCQPSFLGCEIVFFFFSRKEN